MPKNVIIIGMPRSGTSLTTAIFSRQGYFLAESESDELRVGDAHNPFGYFESESLIRRNVEIFRRAGFEHDNTWLYSAIPAQAAASISKLMPCTEDRELIETSNRHAPWVWKDPRLCYTLGYWWQLLDPGGTAVLFIRRSTDDIYQSFIRLGWREPGQAARNDVEMRSQDHWRAAEAAIDEYKIPCLAIDYADYQKKPEEIVRRINETFGLALTVNDLNFQRDLNHGTLKSRVVNFLTRTLSRLPRPVRKFIKMLAPHALLLRLFPEKKFVQK